MELFVRRALLQSRSKHFAKEKLESGRIQSSMRPLLFHQDRDPPTLGFRSQLAPHLADDVANRHVLTSDGRKQGGRITQPVRDQLLERSRVARRYAAEAGIH